MEGGGGTQQSRGSLNAVNISSSHTEEGVQQVSSPLNEGEYNKFYSLKGGCRNLAHCFLFSVRRCVGKAGIFLGLGDAGLAPEHLKWPIEPNSKGPFPH